MSRQSNGNNLHGPDNDLYKVFEQLDKIVKKYNTQYITVEILALSLLTDKNVQKAINACGADYKQISKEIEVKLEEEIGEYNSSSCPSGYAATTAFENVLKNAATQAGQAGKTNYGCHHVMGSLMAERESYARYVLEQHGVTRSEFLRQYHKNINPGGVEHEIDPVTGELSNRASDPLTAYCINLNEMAKNGKIDILIGREYEVRRAIQILSRRRKNNPILVGEPGVGKTAIAEGIAYKIVNGQAPKYMEDATLYSLDMGTLLAGTKFRGEFEERLKDVIAAIKKKNEEGKAILFIDEIHTIIGAGATSGGAMDAGNILKPALAKGEIRCMGSTTYKEFNKHFEKDEALRRRFQKVDVSEPSPTEAKDILRGLRTYFEDYHGISFTDEAIDAAVTLSVKHIHDNKLPDKAIDILDEAGAAQRLLSDDERATAIGVPEIEAVVTEIARIPEINVREDDSAVLRDLSSVMKNFVFNQDTPIDALVRSIKVSRAGLRAANKPVGSYLFAGPTGVGKTEVAKQLARLLGVHFERIDMSEFMEKHSVSKLIGTPPGYVGHDNTEGLLIETVDRHPHMVLLLDEVEKAHPDIFNVLLQVMDNATLKNSHGKKVYFENVIIIMTSNAGAAQTEKRSIGFGSGFHDGAMEQEVKRLFAPEFRNRLDNIMYFNRLDENVMINIVDKFLNELQVQLDEKDIVLEITDNAKEWLAKKGYEPAYGARPLGRVIQTHIKDDLADEILFGPLKNGGVAMVDIDSNDENKLTITSRKYADPKKTKPVLDEVE